MEKKEILDYVMNTPRNTNRAVLSGMLDSVAEGGSGGSGISTIVLVTTGDVEGEYAVESGITVEDILNEREASVYNVLVDPQPGDPDYSHLYLVNRGTTDRFDLEKVSVFPGMQPDGQGGYSRVADLIDSVYHFRVVDGQIKVTHSYERYELTSRS